MRSVKPSQCDGLGASKSGPNFEQYLNSFSDKEIIRLAKNGTKRILITAPAFIADCLETTVEIGIE